MTTWISVLSGIRQQVRENLSKSNFICIEHDWRIWEVNVKSMPFVFNQWLTCLYRSADHRRQLRRLPAQH